ncbi:MAG: PLD nuclease N-terminal domain-containing protein [Planctomycetota bacterium]|nr:PLD nuclease N-terminal domain-containing protein [Planctomycetota bacterium]
MQGFGGLLGKAVNWSFTFGGGALLCGFGLFGLALLGFWIWTLVDAINNPKLDSNTRLIWVLVIVLVGPLGSLIYLLAGR